MRIPRRRSLSVLAAVSLGAGVLLSTTAARADVYSSGEIDPGYGAYDNTCPISSTLTGQSTVPLMENGGPASNTATLHAVSTNSGDPSDNVTADLSDTTTAELTSAGGSIAAMHFASTGSVHKTTSSATTACRTDVNVQNEVNFDFTVTTPGYLNLTFQNHGPSYGEFEITSAGDQEDYFDLEDEYNHLSSTQSVYLVPGEYEGYYESYPYTRPESPVFNDGTTSTRADTTFTPDGTPAPQPAPASTSAKGMQATPSVGKALGYASLPLARSCATGTLVENVTSSRSAAKTIQKVSVFVDGAKALTVKHPKAGQALTVPVADTGAARTVRTVVVTARRSHHTGHRAKRKTYSSYSTYQACS